MKKPAKGWLEKVKKWFAWIPRVLVVTDGHSSCSFLPIKCNSVVHSVFTLASINKRRGEKSGKSCHTVILPSISTAVTMAAEVIVDI